MVILFQLELFASIFFYTVLKQKQFRFKLCKHYLSNSDSNNMMGSLIGFDDSDSSNSSSDDEEIAEFISENAQRKPRQVTYRLLIFSQNHWTTVIFRMLSENILWKLQWQASVPLFVKNFCMEVIKVNNCMFLVQSADLPSNVGFWPSAEGERTCSADRSWFPGWMPQGWASTQDIEKSSIDSTTTSNYSIMILNLWHI